MNITNENKKSGWIVLSADKTKFDQVSTTNGVQDNFEAQQPHRVMIEMQQRGKIWVGVQDDGTYNRTATTNWSFDSENLLIQAKILTNSVPKTSTYKVKVVNNDSEEKGTFLLQDTTESFPNSGNDTDGKPFNNYYFAVKLGSGVNNGRALMEIGTDQQQVELALEKRTMQNLHEQSVVPSANKIVKTLASLSPWVKLKNGYYSETETEVWWFDDSIMEAVVMSIVLGSSGNPETNASRFALEMSRDVGTVEGAFLLKDSDNKTHVITDYPGNAGTPISTSFDNYKDKYMYVLTGTSTTANRAYVGFGDDVDQAKTQKPSTPNYYTRADAPLSAETIQAAVDNAKNNGHLYVELATRAVTVPGNPSPGLFVPYDTKEVNFSVDPLQVTITTINSNNTRTTNVYPLQIVKAENQGKAIVKYLGTGPLALKFAGIGVQNAVTSGSVPTGTYLILVNGSTKEEAEKLLNTAFTANEWTHNLKNREQLGDEYLKVDPGEWVSVDNVGVGSIIEYTNQFYDSRNTTNIKFKTQNKKAQISLVVNGVSVDSEYDYEVMHTNINNNTSNTIVSLSGLGAYNGKFLGFSIIQDDLGDKAGKISIGNNFSSTKTSLDAAHTNFYKLSALTPKDDILKRADSTQGSATGIGDSVVKVDDRGIYNGEDTQEFFFDVQNKTLTVLTVNGANSKTHKYSMIFPKNSSNLPSNNQQNELESRFYLKSFENNMADPLHKHFVEMKVEAGASPKKIRFASSAQSLTEASNQFLALDNQPNQWNYTEKTSTAIDMRVVVAASGRSWSKLVDTDNLYYYDPNNTETWTFDPAVKTATVVSSGSSSEVYRIGMKDSVSSSEGIFVLASSERKRKIRWTNSIFRVRY